MTDETHGIGFNHRPDNRMVPICSPGLRLRRGWQFSIAGLSAGRTIMNPNGRPITHGATRRGKVIPEYKIWRGMLARCLYPSTQSYPRYGGRGIVVCARWQKSFVNFFTDMGRRPTPKHQIDRIDNDGNYTPENCCWKTSMEQRRNMHTNRWITFNGTSKILKDWALLYGVAEPTLAYRLARGWSVEKTLLTPSRNVKNRHKSPYIRS